MSDHIFLCVHLANQETVGASTLLAFQTVQEADRYIQDWLEQSCGLECYRGAEEEAKLRKENEGELPELSFSCPVLKGPSDLEQYNGFYYFGPGGAIHLYVMAIYDEDSAVRFRAETIKEFELDKTFSDEADEMMDRLEVLERSFRETIDYTAALHQIDSLIKNGGLSLF